MMVWLEINILHGGTNEVRDCIKEYVENVRVVHTVSNRLKKMSSLHNIILSYLSFFQAGDLREQPIIKGVVTTD